MVFRVRVELPPSARRPVHAAVRKALQLCPEPGRWEVLLREDVLHPEAWEAVVTGPRQEPPADWTAIEPTGGWLRSEDLIYTRVFEGSAEHDPDFIRDALSDLFRCLFA